MKTKTKTISLLFTLFMVVCFASCNKKESNEPAAQSIDANQLVGTWNVKTYSKVKTNLDADTIVFQEVRNQGVLKITKQGEDYYYEEKFLAEGEKNEGKLEIDGKTINFSDADGFLRDDFIESLTVTLSDKSLALNYVGEGTSSSYVIINGERKEVSYKMRLKIDILLSK